MRSGTKSASWKFQTSFCNATHALNSSMLWQGRISTRGSAADEEDDKGEDEDEEAEVTPRAPLYLYLWPEYLWPQNAWPVATGPPFVQEWPLRAFALVRATAAPSIRNDGGTCDSSGAGRTRGPRKGGAQG